MVFFSVCSKKELLFLISIFDNYQLNGIKYLDYISFREAFFLYSERVDKLNQPLDKISKIQKSMNKNRTDFKLPENYKIQITPY